MQFQETFEYLKESTIFVVEKGIPEGERVVRFFPPISLFFSALSKDSCKTSGRDGAGRK